MPKARKIAFSASETPQAQDALASLSARYGNADATAADVIVALGGDGFMLQTLHGTMELDAPVYGMNCGTIGFLMNEFHEDDLPDRLSSAAEEEVINPLTRWRAGSATGGVHQGRAGDQRGLAAARRAAGRPELRIFASTGASGWPSSSATARWSARLRGRPPTTTPRTGRSCRSARTCWH